MSVANYMTQKKLFIIQKIKFTKMDEINDRQKDFPWMKKDSLATLIGVGGIGSWVGFLLARIGYSLIMYDGDRVEPHNLGGQLFKITDVGEFKTSSLIHINNDFSNWIKTNVFGYFVENSFVTNITILGLDNMATRKLAVTKWKKLYDAKNKDSDTKSPLILIDGRLEGEQGIIYTIDSQETYDAWMDEWFPDDKISDGPCTMRATSYNGAMIASNIIAILNNKVANYYAGDTIREVPYKIEYGLPGFIFDVTHKPILQSTILSS